MKSLKDRLAERKKEYKNICKREKEVEKFIQLLMKVAPDLNIAYFWVFAGSANIYLTVKSAEDFESEMISKISDLISGKWERAVNASEIEYTTSHSSGDYRIGIKVTTEPDKKACRITPIKTGRLIDVDHVTTRKEEEVIYLMECADG